MHIGPLPDDTSPYRYQQIYCGALPKTKPNRKLGCIESAWSWPTAVALAAHDVPRAVRDLDLLDEWLRYTGQWRTSIGADTAPDLGLPPLENGFAPYPYQIHAAQWLTQIRAGLLADEPGTGKTVQALTAARIVAQYRPDVTVLVVAPAPVIGQWATETKRWFPEATVFTPSNKKEALMVCEHTKAASTPTVLVMTYERAKTLTRQAAYGKYKTIKEEGPLNAAAADIVVADEAHYLKNPSAARTRAIWWLLHNAQYRWLLTGTPTTQHGAEIWSLLHGLYPKDFPSYQQFKSRFFNLEVTPYSIIVRDRKTHMIPEWDKIITPLIRRVTKQEVINDLPDRTFTTRTVTMVGAHKKMYQQMQDIYATWDQDGNLAIARSAAIQAGKLTQLAAGEVEVDEGGTPIKLVKSPKVDAMMDLVTGDYASKQIVVTCVHRVVAQAAYMALMHADIPAGLVIGGTTKPARQETIDQFKNGGTRVLVMTVAAGGTGLDLVESNTMIRLQRSWSLVENVQAVDRIYRATSGKHHDSVHVVDIITDKTVEVTQLERLRAKQASAADIIKPGSDWLGTESNNE